MARRKAKEVEEVEELEDLVELSDDIDLEEILEDVAEAAEDTPHDDGGDALSAKEAAKRIGTDGRTLRKFLRSQRGLVGQGNRWAIMEDEIDDLKEKFEAWQKPKAKEVKVALKPLDDDDVDEIEDLDFDLDD